MNMSGRSDPSKQPHHWDSPPQVISVREGRQKWSAVASCVLVTPPVFCCPSVIDKTWFGTTTQRKEKEKLAKILLICHRWIWGQWTSLRVKVFRSYRSTWAKLPRAQKRDGDDPKYSSRDGERWYLRWAPQDFLNNEWKWMEIKTLRCLNVYLSSFDLVGKKWKPISQSRVWINEQMTK